MNPWIHSVKIHDQFSNVLEVEDMNGAKRHYLEYQGTFIAGRVYTTFSDSDYKVAFFLPYLDGLPTVLKVTPK